MRSLGKLPIRSLQSFGVAGLLGDECRVFYENLFSTRHVGRVADLLAAKLKGAGPDELRLRALVAYAAHEAFALGGNPEGKAPVTAVAPVSFECGVDAEKVAIGLGFVRAPSVPFDMAGLADRVRAGAPQGPFEAMLAWLFVHADRLVIRHQPSIRRMEIVALVGLPGKVDAATLAGAHDLELVTLEQSPPRAPKAASYVQLADLDYHRLLGSETPPGGQQTVSLGEILSSTPMVETGMPATLVKAQSEATSEDRRVSGGDGREDSFIKIAGSQSELNEGALGANDALRYNARISELQRQVMKLESELDLAKKSKGPVSEAVSPDTVIGAQADAGIADDAESPLLKELTGELEKSIQAAGANAAELKKELEGPRAKRLLDGIMGELVAERSKVSEVAKKLNVTIRQKEIEFRNKTQVLSEELRLSADQLKQKTFAHARTKEQLTQALVTIEKLRQQQGDLGDESAGAIKAKYGQQQKLVSALKDENTSLLAKVEELKSLLSAEKSSAKNRGPSFQDFSSLQGRYERAQRQADEFKRTNQQLLERLSEQRKDRGADGASADEVRKRLEAATKLVANQKKDQERLNQKLEEMRKEELRLKGELNKAVTELKRARSAGFGSPTQAMGVPKKDGGSGSGGQAA